MLIDLEDLGLYGYCPLKYRYKVEWKLPYRELSPEQAYHDVLRKAASHLLLTMARDVRRNQSERSIQLFDHGWRAACRSGNFTPGKIAGIKLEGHLALLELSRSIRLGDEVVGGAFLTSVAVNEGLALVSQLDGLLIRGGPIQKNLLIIHVSNERSPLWGPRYQPLIFQWGLEVIRKQLGYDRGRVGHLIFSPWTSRPPKVIDAIPERAEFRAASEALAHGIRSKVYFQTPHRERCKVCCFKGICTACHCGVVQPKEIERAKEALT